MHLIDKSNAEVKHDSIFCFRRILSDESSHMSAKVGQHLLSKKRHSKLRACQMQTSPLLLRGTGLEKAGLAPSAQESEVYRLRD